MTYSVHPDDEYTQDGSVDVHGKPSVKNKSGNWKACPFILGTCDEPLNIKMCFSVYNQLSQPAVSSQIFTN